MGPEEWGLMWDLSNGMTDWVTGYFEGGGGGGGCVCGQF